jgi:hypothetical protein
MVHVRAEPELLLWPVRLATVDAHAAQKVTREAVVLLVAAVG